jgi:hypothetical protein
MTDNRRLVIAHAVDRRTLRAGAKYPETVRVSARFTYVVFFAVHIARRFDCLIRLILVGRPSLGKPINLRPSVRQSVGPLSLSYCLIAAIPRFHALLSDLGRVREDCCLLDRHSHLQLLAVQLAGAMSLEAGKDPAPSTGGRQKQFLDVEFIITLPTARAFANYWPDRSARLNRFYRAAP